MAKNFFKPKEGKKNKFYVGKIDGNELLMNRERGFSFETGKVHKSEKDYSRAKNRKLAKEAMKGDY